ncbi:hypothetical protein [Marinobacterium jannaschii]|uniref:hypothetical protein n=1 Tax=Marinobacterium jannaschii TaxID=64970 RepID=UPI000AE4BA7F|nr:hypothetical protein [Marinobacterium jannaschii]
MQAHEITERIFPLPSRHHIEAEQEGWSYCASLFGRDAEYGDEVTTHLKARFEAAYPGLSVKVTGKESRDFHYDIIVEIENPAHRTNRYKN